jgi:YYY domain-containing protein
MTLLIVLSRQNRSWQKYAGSTVLLTVLGPVLVMLLALTGVLLSAAGRDYVQGIVNDPNVQQILGEATISSLVQTSLWRRLVNPWTFIFVGGLLGWALALFVGGLEGWKNGGMEDWKVGDEEARRRGDEEVTRQGEVELAMQAGDISQNLELSPETFGGRRPALRPKEVPNGSAVSGHFSAPEQFVLILILVGLALPLSVEFIFLRDNFGIRMNTIFKFYFQAWVLLALASAFAVYYVSKKLPALIALIWQIGLAVLVAAGLVYPVLAIPNKADFFQNEPTLNGMAWIANYNPGDYAAIEWLRANAADDAVVLEAPGAQYAAYQYTGRISALTGLPTLLGWGGHQSQWRGNYDEPARREPDIDLLYNTPDIRQAQMLLDKYGISYVIVGPLERERYASPGLRKFEQFKAVAFQQDNTTIYQRR